MVEYEHKLVYNSHFVHIFLSIVHALAIENLMSNQKTFQTIISCSEIYVLKSITRKYVFFVQKTFKNPIHQYASDNHTGL